MSPREIIYYFFYGAGFITALVSGIMYGFTDTHTPPMPFLIELLTLFIGFIIAFIDLCRFRPVTSTNMRVHIYGWIANGTLMLLVLALGHK